MVFLPSSNNKCETVLFNESGYRVFIDDNDIKNGSNIKTLKKNEKHNLKIKTVFDHTLFEKDLYIYEGKSIPSVFVSLINGTSEDINKEKGVGKEGLISVVKSDSTIDYSGKVKCIKSRGNVTWYASKKPYIIEFDNDVDLLNMGAGKSGFF